MTGLSKSEKCGRSEAGDTPPKLESFERSPAYKAKPEELALRRTRVRTSREHEEVLWDLCQL